MSDNQNYNDQIAIFQKVMKEEMDHLDKLNEELLKQKEQAIDQEIAAKDELKRIQNEAETISRAYIEKHQKEYDARVRNDTLMNVTERLLSFGRTATEIVRWLGVPDVMIEKAMIYLGFEMLDGRPATVTYESKGRGGNVNFSWDGQFASFYYEFGGGNTLATIDIPEEPYWEKNTGIPLEKRMIALQFIAKRILRDQAPNYQYEINPGEIRIFTADEKKPNNE